MSKSGVVAVLAWGVFVWWIAHHTVKDALWRKESRRARAYVAAEQAAEAAMALRSPPPPEEPCQCDICTGERMPAVEIKDREAFNRCMEEWGKDLMPTFNALHDLDVYWAEDWEPVG